MSKQRADLRKALREMREQLEAGQAVENALENGLDTGLDEDSYSDYEDVQGTYSEPAAWVAVPTLATAILDAQHTVVRTKVKEWSAFFEKTKMRTVAYDEVDGVGVSTVFLGINYGAPPNKPLWFESLVTGGDLDGHMERYTTWSEAEDGHALIVGLLRSIVTIQRTVIKRVERERRNNVVGD
jgi:hypothetical protein